MAAGREARHCRRGRGGDRTQDVAAHEPPPPGQIEYNNEGACSHEKQGGPPCLVAYRVGVVVDVQNAVDRALRHGAVTLLAGWLIANGVDAPQHPLTAIPFDQTRHRAFRRLLKQAFPEPCRVVGQADLPRRIGNGYKDDVRLTPELLNDLR